MLWLQKTVDREVSCEGVGLHSGLPARMTFAPAEPNTGIFFEVPGDRGTVCIEAVVENAMPEADLVRATTLAKDGVKIHTVEHVLGALAGMGITNCYITGTVRASGYVGSMGGLVGCNDGSITNSYSTASVSGEDVVGGLAGSNHGSITNCYSTGSVTGNGNVGGLADIGLIGYRTFDI